MRDDAEYGVIQNIYVEEEPEYHSNRRTVQSKKNTRLLPGVSPLVYSRFLLEQTAVDNPDKGIVDGALPYTHEDLALVVGLSRVTVTRVLGEFQRQGWVECGYRKIRVRDREGLRQALGRFGKSAS